MLAVALALPGAALLSSTRLPTAKSSVAATPTLVTSYSACCELLLNEIAATQAGDVITLGIYLLEGGSSSNRVLSALEEAGRERAVHVNFALDVSYVSMISRIIEKTDTLIPRVSALASSEPEWCSCTWGSKPDHGKYALFMREGHARADSAILGGINFGDRFTTWDDYAVRLPPPHAEGLRDSLLLAPPSARPLPLSGAPTEEIRPITVEAARTIAIACPLSLFHDHHFCRACSHTGHCDAALRAGVRPFVAYAAGAATLLSGVTAAARIDLRHSVRRRTFLPSARAQRLCT